MFKRLSWPFVPTKLVLDCGLTEIRKFISRFDAIDYLNDRLVTLGHADSGDLTMLLVLVLMVQEELGVAIRKNSG